MLSRDGVAHLVGEACDQGVILDEKTSTAVDLLTVIGAQVEAPVEQT